LETLHKKGFVHCDIKPDNMLIAAMSEHHTVASSGASSSITDSNIYLVDFGLAHPYLDKNGLHVRQPNRVSFKGTISYCSLNLLDKQCKFTHSSNYLASCTNNEKVVWIQKLFTEKSNMQFLSFWKILHKDPVITINIYPLDPSRRDDLESLLYVVLFLFFGELPWHRTAQTLQGRERLDFVIRMK